MKERKRRKTCKGGMMRQTQDEAGVKTKVTKCFAITQKRKNIKVRNIKEKFLSQLNQTIKC